MQNIRRSHDAAFKARVALEALREEKTISHISSEYGVHTNQIRQWRQRLLEEIPRMFSDRRKKADKEDEVLLSELYRQIGQLKVKLKWLKKIASALVKEKRRLIEPNHSEIAIDRQCYLLDLSRSSYCYWSRSDDRYNNSLMKLIDEQYTKTLFYGVIRMRRELIRRGHAVSEKQIRRLMRLMDLAAIYPKPRLSKAAPEHKIYLYLLRGMAIDR